MSKTQTVILDVLSVAGLAAGAFAAPFQAWVGHHPFAAAVGVAVGAILHRVAPSW